MHEPIAAGLVVPGSCSLVVVEGNYLLLQAGLWQEVASLLDECWYIDTPDDVRVRRLMQRSLAAGRGPAEAEAWVHEVDEPNARLIEASGRRATLRVLVTEDLTQ